MAHATLSAVGALALSLCFSATALVTARSSAAGRTMAGGEFYHTYDEDEDWDSDAREVQRIGGRWYHWVVNSRFVSQENFGNEGKFVNVGAIRFRADEPGRRYIVSVEAVFTDHLLPVDMAGSAMEDWSICPRSDLVPVWHALRAALIRNLQIPPGEEYRLESEPRAYELGGHNEEGDETLFTFHENQTALARKRVRNVVDRLEMKGLKRRLYGPDGYRTQRDFHDAIQDGRINNRVPKRDRE